MEVYLVLLIKLVLHEEDFPSFLCLFSLLIHILKKKKLMLHSHNFELTPILVSKAKIPLPTNNIKHGISS